MQTPTFEDIIGDALAGKPAQLRFFGTITAESTARFNEAFDYLENVVRPSLIRVLINCEGGSVLHGMSTYSTIQNSSLPTECVIEGMAASMGSVIWAAGKKSLMRDYAILMIHNPFLPTASGEEADDMVQAFTAQIETIYRKRFGLNREQVRSIMQGEAGKDGTYFDAASAVAAGIIPPTHVLATCRQLREKVRSEVTGIEDAAAIQAVMNRIDPAAYAPAATVTPAGTDSSILIQTESNHSKMNEDKNLSPEYSAVVASLGLQEKQEVKDVLARITELTAVEAKLSDTTKALSDAQTVIAGKDATIGNLQKDLDGVTARLQTYEQKEADEKAEAIRQFLQTAADQGKIEASTIPTWSEMARTNFSLVQNTIDSIPAREKISQQIAADPGNVQAAAAAAKTAEEKMAEKVAAAVGENFQFKKLK